MEVLKVNYEIGKKCYTRYNGAFHECIFLGTKGVINYRNFMMPCYVLNMAGVGIVNLEFDRSGEFDNWYHRTDCNTTLYRTIDDCMARRNPITAKYGATDNCFNENFMQSLFTDMSVCNYGGGVYAYIWDGTDAVRVSGGIACTYWEFGKNGFRTDAHMGCCTMVGGLRVYRNVKKTYATSSACLADNKPVIVTF